MLIAFCLIMILLCAGAYSWFHGGDALPDMEVPREKVQVLHWVNWEPAELPDAVI